MRLDIHLHHHGEHELASRVTDRLDILMANQETLMDMIDRLVQDVAKQQTVIASMETFIGNLKHQIAEALSGAKLPAEIEAKLAAIFPTLEGNTDRITAAIVENTDAAPTTTDAPTTAPDYTNQKPTSTDPAPEAKSAKAGKASSGF